MIDRGLWLAPVLLVAAHAATAQADSSQSRESLHGRTVTAIAIDTAPPMDGRLDAPAWARADSITDFRQRDPAEGAEASERTVVKILHDHDALYVGVRAWDRDARTPT